MGLSHKTVWSLTCLALSQFGSADQPQIIAPEGSDHIEGSPFNKHDPTRPQPEKILNTTHLPLPPPSDAIIIFDGKNLDAFQKRGNTPHLSTISSDNNFLTLGPGGLTTNESFGDCQLHAEWRVPEKAEIKGQKGSNSGIVMMGVFEIQILESYNNLTYADGLAGALYGERPPLVNASSEKGQWQSFDLVFKAPIYQDNNLIQKATLTLFHNGILCHHNQSFENLSSYRKHIPYPKYDLKKGPIHLKWDGDPVQFRNIWIRPIHTYDQTPPVETSGNTVNVSKEETLKTKTITN